MAYGVAISQVDPCAIRGVTAVLGTNAIRGSPRRLWDHGGAGRPKKVVAFYNGRGTAEQWIKEGKNAVKWTRLSCVAFRAERRPAPAACAGLQPRQLLAHPGVAEGGRRVVPDQPTEKVVKIGAKVVAHGRHLVFQMAEVAVPQELFRRLLDQIAGLRPPAVARC